jgi:hypothetical protein
VDHLATDDGVCGRPAHAGQDVEDGNCTDEFGTISEA